MRFRGASRRPDPVARAAATAGHCGYAACNLLGMFAVTPPVEPMLAKLAEELPAGAFWFEPKWDGFRAIVFRSAA